MTKMLTDSNDDALYAIFCAITDFASLSFAMRALNRRAYSVFKANRAAVMHAVARNLIGPSLPQAFRVVSNVGGREEPSEDALREAMASLTLQQRKRLEKNHSVMLRLEDLFSHRFASPTVSPRYSHPLCLFF